MADHFSLRTYALFILALLAAMLLCVCVGSVSVAPKDTLTALAERLLATEEARNARTTSITDMIAKLGPMFGLLGTLIPLGPGIVALGQGDTVTLSESMNVAFDTTIAGVISAAVASVISHIRKRWYNDDMVSLETLMEAVLEEVTSDVEG